MAEERQTDPTAEARRLYEEAESRTAQAFEEAVSRGSFGELLARMTENVVAAAKIGTDVFDLMLRNMRLAGRQDVTRLARQLNRTEDKLEQVLQEVEQLQEERAFRGGGEQQSTRRRSQSTRRRSRTSANGSDDGDAAETSSRARGRAEERA